MSFKLREIFFFLGILWATTLPPGNAEGNHKGFASASTSTSCGVPDVMCQYNMAEFPKFSPECTPDSSKILCEKNVNALQWYSERESDYKNLVTQQNNFSKFWPKRLSITVSKDEDAIVAFKDETPNQNLQWRKGGEDWHTVPLSPGKKVVLPHNSLNGSGFVSFASSTMPAVNNISLYGGTVQIIIRECPRDRYGEDCTGWCKDCMYGGICHGRSGECVCPPGRKGNQCEKGCKLKGSYGRNCEQEEQKFKYIQYCLPSPYGCSCGPGYTGFRCLNECGKGRWGVDCSQSCGHCKSNTCDRENGKCLGDADVRPCAGDLLGLRRLRKKPNVTISSGHAEVSFEKEYDGRLPRGAKMMGYQVVVWETDQEMKDGQTYNVSASESSAKLSSLEYCTDYQVAVLVLVQLESSKGCIVNGALRGERIHKHPFSICSAEITELLNPPVVPEIPDGELPKIILPKAINPPISQYVVVMESKDNIAKDVWKKRSVEIVKEYIANNTSKETSIDPSEEKIEGWVAGKVNVKDNSTEIFEIGNGIDDNKPLDEKKYSVVVVTEKKSGNGSEFISSGPVNINGKAVASGLSGIMFGALIFLILIALFAWSYKKNQSKVVVRTPQEDPDNWNPIL